MSELKDISLKAAFESLSADLRDILNQDAVQKIKATKKLKEKLDLSLPGPLRQKLIGQLNATVTQTFDHNLYLLFIDCILDDSFTECNLHLHFSVFTREQSIEFPLQLLKIVAQNAPLIKSLSLCSFQSYQLGASLAEGLQPLQKLETLLLVDKDRHLSSEEQEEVDISFFCSLGECCPNLISLKLKHMSFEFHHLIALMFGNKQQLLPAQFLQAPTSAFAKKLQWIGVLAVATSYSETHTHL